MIPLRLAIPVGPRVRPCWSSLHFPRTTSCSLQRVFGRINGSSVGRLYTIWRLACQSIRVTYEEYKHISKNAGVLFVRRDSFCYILDFIMTGRIVDADEDGQLNK